MNINERLLVMESRNHWKLLVANELLWLKEYNAFYGACSKNACTKTKSILASLASTTGTFDGNPHFRRQSGLLGPYDLSPADRRKVLLEPGTFRFAFVRDPYARIVSCFRNRVDQLGLEPFDNEAGLKNAHLGRRRKILAWKTGMEPGSVDPNHAISFRDFIEFVCDEDPYEMDRHWYYQSRSIQSDLIDYDFIGRVENYNADLATILSTIGAPADFAWEGDKVNASGTSSSLDSYFDAETAALFARTFEEDFDNFQYPTAIPSLKSSVVAGNAAFEQRPEPQPAVRIPDRKAAVHEIGIVIPTIMRFDSLRRLVLSIRKHYGNDIEIQVGVQGTEDRSLREFGRRYRLNLHFLPEDFGVAATRNFLVRQVSRPFVLLCDDDFAFHELTNIEGAWSLLQARPDISIVGGLLDDVTQNDRGRAERQNWINYANFISYDRTQRRVTFLPCEYVECECYPWDKGSFHFCDTVQNFFLARKSLFDDESLHWDERIKFQGEREDFFLTLFEKGHKGIVFYSGMVAEHHHATNAAYKSLAGRTDWASHWMAKRGIEQFLVFGKWSDYYDSKTGEYARTPFKYLDANETPILSENMNIPYRDAEYMHVSMPRSFAAAEAQIVSMEKALRAARNRAESLSAKLNSKDNHLKTLERRMRTLRAGAKQDGNQDDTRVRFESEYAAALNSYSLGKFAEAAKRFMSAWEHNKSSAKALRAAAEAYVRDGNMSEAEDLLRKVCEMRPELPGPRNRLAEISAARQSGVLPDQSQHEFDPGAAAPIASATIQ
ncbi:sulfotransferase family 2 domain-containing protein [Microbaculum marinum]|uniref:Sulfotransferase family 2 domain-containing protein n=1 Tax=Microbaculum marinum TaxID=1764581 RepID=A0AAW9RME0_9HYPH